MRAPAGTPPNTTPAGGYERHFQVEMTIHAEDMYNFNPGAADIATGTRDAANGRLEITGLGREYLNRGTYAVPNARCGASGGAEGSPVREDLESV